MRTIIIQLKALAAILVLVFMNSCEDNGVNDIFATSDKLPITIYMESQPETFSQWVSLMEVAELNHAFNANGTYTMFAPNNEAMTTWLNGRSVSDITKEEARELVFNHVVNKPYIHTQYNEGCIPDTNMVGNYIAIEFGVQGYQSIKVNKESQIIQKDIEMTNGYINEINKVLDIQPTLKGVLSAQDGINIFMEALTATGYDDVLTQCEEYTADRLRRKYFSVMAISDTTFNRFGINSLEDLKSRYSDTDDLTDKANKLNQWVAYHILDGVNYANILIDLDEEQNFKNVMTLADQKGIEIRDDRAIIINRTVTQVSETEESIEETRIYPGLRNIPAKNGCIHFINNLMDFYHVKPCYIRQDIWNVANWRAIENFRSGASMSTEWIKEDVFDEISWHSEPEDVPIGYWQHWNHSWFKGGSGIVLDLKKTNSGWVEFQTPYLAEGNYKVVFMGHKNPNGGRWNVYLDGVPAGVLDNYFTNTGWAYNITAITNAKISSGVHTIRVELATGNGYIGFGDVKYYPL